MACSRLIANKPSINDLFYLLAYSLEETEKMASIFKRDADQDLLKEIILKLKLIREYDEKM